MNILVIQTLLAFLAGFWRVVDGRGKKWFPFDTALRNGATLGLALIISYLALGLTPTAGIFAVLAAASIVVGKINRDSYAHMLVRYTAPAVIAVGTGTVIGQADLTYGIWYIALCALPGVVYPSMQRWGQKFGEWGVYTSEFVVGATVLGGISVL